MPAVNSGRRVRLSPPRSSKLYISLETMSVVSPIERAKTWVASNTGISTRRKPYRRRTRSNVCTTVWNRSAASPQISWVPLIFWGPLLIGAPLACFRGRGSGAQEPLIWTEGQPLFHGAVTIPFFGDSAAMRSALLAFALLTSTAAIAQLPANFTKATPAPRIDRIPPARDVAYPGTIQLTVDATDTIRAHLHGSTSMCRSPSAGDFVLLYPKWLPGQPFAERPDQQGGRFRRHRRTASALHLGARPARRLRLPHRRARRASMRSMSTFDYVSPTAENQGRVVMTPDLASIEWIANSLYPAGYYVRDIPIQAISDGSARLERGDGAPARARRRDLDHQLSGDELPDIDGLARSSPARIIGASR